MHCINYRFIKIKMEKQFITKKIILQIQVFIINAGIINVEAELIANIPTILLMISKK